MVAGSCYACSKGVDLAVMKSNQLWEKITKYNISASNVYNFDKKGFQIRLSCSTKQIVSRD
jgi:hypothetical protein